MDSCFSSVELNISPKMAPPEYGPHYGKCQKFQSEAMGRIGKARAFTPLVYSCLRDYRLLASRGKNQRRQEEMTKSFTGSFFCVRLSLHGGEHRVMHHISKMLRFRDTKEDTLN